LALAWRSALPKGTERRHRVGSATPAQPTASSVRCLRSIEEILAHNSTSGRLLGHVGRRGLGVTHHRDSNPRPLAYSLEPSTILPEVTCDTPTVASSSCTPPRGARASYVRDGFSVAWWQARQDQVATSDSRLSSTGTPDCSISICSHDNQLISQQSFGT